MSLLELIVIFVLFGVALWAINKYIPMQEGVRKLLNIAVVVVLVLLLLRTLGLFSGLGSVQVGP